MKDLMMRDSRLALSQCPGLVKDNGFDLVGPLQCITPLDQDPTGGSHPSTHHDSSRGGETQGTGAGHHQH